MRQKVEGASKESNEAFRSERGVEVIESTINRNWTALHDFAVLKNVHLRPLNPQFEDLLKRVEMVFSPGEGTNEQPAERLSDGLRSLFYLTLIASVFDAEAEAVRSVDVSRNDSPLRGEDLNAPDLTILAIEEPENHLSPHYLGRILKLLKEISGAEGAQVMLTSHSPAILKRVQPEDIRHLRLDTETHSTVVSNIRLPEAADKAHKYVREAVRAYPELYFSRLVVLCEGDSEEIVLPRICELAKVSIDTSFISIVPLGGRHVNHFWKLLAELEIPYVTLLDLDRERGTGGWSRIKYVLEQLIKIGKAKRNLLKIDKKDGGNGVLSDEGFAGMSTWNETEVKVMDGWINCLEGEGVYFSGPLDLDFAMLTSFPEAYHKATSGTGPRVPDATKHPAKYQERLVQARNAVLKNDTAMAESFSDAEKAAFIWYHHLFLGRGKPSTHILALNEIDSDVLWTNAPAPLKRMISKIQEILKIEVEEEENDENLPF